MDAKSYSLLHTQLCGVTSTGHIAPWLRAQPEHTQHGHAQQAGARARTRRRQTARAHRAHSTGTQACAAPSAPVRGRPSHAHACVHWLLWAAATCPPAPPGRRVCGAGREPGPGEMRQGRGRQRRHPAPGSSRTWSHIIHQWTVNAGSSCRRPCWPFHGAGRPHGAACSTAPAPQFTARTHTQRLCSKVRAPDTPVRAQPPPPPPHSPRAASAPHADLVLHARFWRRLSPASRPALEHGWLKISTTSANRPLQLARRKVDFYEGWNDPL